MVLFFSTIPWRRFSSFKRAFLVTLNCIPHLVEFCWRLICYCNNIKSVVIFLVLVIESVKKWISESISPKRKAQRVKGECGKLCGKDLGNIDLMLETCLSLDS